MQETIKNLRDSVFVTILTIVFTNFGLKTWCQYFILYCVIVVTLQALRSTYPIIIFLNNFKRKYLIKVAILNGAVHQSQREYKCVRSWIDITPEMWRRGLEPLFPYFGKWWTRSLHSIPVEDINDSWSIIINPFGDNFPEKNQRLHETFYKICDYISKGGIFVVTGGAFFKHQNPIISNKEELFMTHIINGMQDLENSALFQEFGVRMTGDTFDQNGRLISAEPINVEVQQTQEDIQRFGDVLQGVNSLTRFRSTSLQSSNYIPVIRQANESVFPMAIIPYGKGALIHIGLKISSETSNEFNVVMCFLKGMIKNNLQNVLL